MDLFTSLQPKALALASVTQYAYSDGATDGGLAALITEWQDYLDGDGIEPPGYVTIPTVAAWQDQYQLEGAPNGSATTPGW